MSPWWNLAFVVIGGFISMGTAYFLERVRRTHQRRDKLDEVRRVALARAMAWIDPMENALRSADSAIFALMNGAYDVQKFRSEYPQLLPELAKLDLTPEQRLVVDSDLYPTGNRIRSAIEDLKHDAIQHWESTQYPSNAPAMALSDARLASATKVKQLREQVDLLRQQLGEAYRKTYE